VSGLANAAEAVVIGLAVSGDASAFDELVRRKQSTVRSLMRYLSRDTALAEDLGQQVFVEVWKSLPRLESAAAFHGWLRRIAVNVWLQETRKKDIFSSRSTEPWDDSWEPEAHEAPLGQDIDLANALSRLSATARLCIVLAYHEGMTHAEIAREIDLPLGTVKSHIFRGEKRLKQMLNDYEDEQQ
jgi:RNA polymerase sigma-70 factor (ECF subfamily)